MQATLQHATADGLETREVPGRDAVEGTLDPVGRSWIEAVVPSAERTAAPAVDILADLGHTPTVPAFS